MAGVSETDYSLVRASDIYFGTILHHSSALIISSHHTQRCTQGTPCVCVCACACTLSNVSPCRTYSTSAVHWEQESFSEFIFYELRVTFELNRVLDVQSSSPSLLIPLLHFTHKLVCVTAYAFHALWLIVSQATPWASCIIHPESVCFRDGRQGQDSPSHLFAVWRWAWFPLLRGSDGPAY